MTVVINVYSKSNNVLGTTKAAEAPARPPARAAPFRRVRTNGAEARTSVKTGALTRSPPRPWGRGGGSDFIFRTAAECESNP